jgi:2-polyprenyl-3-methyl-5-hydroxy-6-metoxy-1,4-benzoquinol methylase
MSVSNQTFTFYRQLEAEVVENRDKLQSDNYAILSRYYTSLKNNVDLALFYRYNWMRRVAPMQTLLCSLPPRELDWRILDAGCGVGTESIFWSTLRDDIEVTGVDISQDRLDVAQARKNLYERRWGKPLQVSFLQQDIFRILEDKHFDVVWTMEAISHIDPAEEFLTAVSKSVGDRGYVVISDSHILNPAMAWRIFRARRRGVDAHTHKTTATGKIISYAQERLFTVGQLSRMLRLAGFSSMQVQLSIFFPPVLARVPSLFSIGPGIDRILNKIPVLRNLGGIYTIIAKK